MSFAPMAHSSPRRFAWQTATAGGRVFFVNDDNYPHDSDKLQTLIAEAMYCRPVVMSSTPRLWNALHSLFCDRLEAAKKQWPDKSASQVRQEVLLSCRLWLGGRLRLATIGGGSSSAEVQSWMFDCFQCIINNGFGATETGYHALSTHLFTCSPLKF
jgi:long-subunit acyl-CoA synthetase (AMP-forming)